MFDGNLKGEAFVVVTLKHAKLNWGHVRPNSVYETIFPGRTGW
jgi:hypothetical protein